MVAAIAATAALASSAGAAELSVREAPGEPNVAELEFRAEPGEDNRLTVTYEAKEPGYWLLEVRDEGISLTPGNGCSGGGAPGAVVHCRIHEPAEGDYEPCGKMCARLIPGTSWKDSFRISLGDGDNSFDGSAFSGLYAEGVAMSVSSGNGKDRIVTGGAADTVDPGAGSDEVVTGEGHDLISTTPDQDGSDSYESGESFDDLSYAQRVTPVHLQGTVAGAPGEDDHLHGYFNVIGGTADDVLTGGPNNYVLGGGPGNDVLTGGNSRGNELYGGPGSDRLSSAGAAESISHLHGEEGDDSYFGGPGTSMIREDDPDTDSGNDTASGGSGTDYIELGAGDDFASGGLGNDGLHGGDGHDQLFGGPGGDFVIGGAEFDRLFGGTGRDQLFSGRWTWNFPSPKRSFPFPSVQNDGPDFVNCGPGQDKAFSNPRDRIRRCEGKQLRPRPRGRGTR